jgi:Reverse transcriptase (RNA-dependent DNA polymerase)
LQFFLDKIYICYLDNILVYSEDKKQYVTYIKQVLEILAKKGFRLKLSKYNFYTKEIIFLGYVIILGKISLDPEKVRVITTWETLTIIKQI